MTDQKNGMSKADKMLADAQQAKIDENIDRIVQPIMDNTVRGAIVGMQAVRFDHVLRSVARCSARSIANFFGGPDTPEANKVVRDFRNQARLEFARTLHETPLARPAPAPGSQEAPQANPLPPQPDNAVGPAEQDAKGGDQPATALEELGEALQTASSTESSEDQAEAKSA